MLGHASQAIWISWQEHRRTREICRYFELPLYELLYRGGLARYPMLMLRTTGCLLRHRPRTLLVQNPSIVLSFYAIVLRVVFRYRLIVDAHNEAVEPHNYPNGVVRWIAHFLLRGADFTIVTNEHLADIVRSEHGRPIVLPDKLPAAPPTPDRAVREEHTLPAIVLIATYAKDEPVSEIIEAAGKLDGQLRLLITGNAKRFLAARSEPIPSNVQFTGFLPDEAYWLLLQTSAAIIDLTLKDNCLVCGAYEGVAAGVPLILSDNRATRHYFRRGVIYTDASPASIRAALVKALETREALTREIGLLKHQLDLEWPQLALRLTAAIDA